MNQYVDMIANTTLTQSLPRAEIEDHLRSGAFKVVTYKKNSVMHFDGELCHKLEIILSGKVVVDRIDQAGNLLTIAAFSTDDILGGSLMFSKNPYYPMTVTTQLPSTILEIGKETLFALFCQNPAFLQTYLEMTSDRTFILGDKIKHYVQKTIRESILSYLQSECKKQNSTNITLTITKKALAEKIGVQRTSLSRELAKMKADGLITYDAKSITLLRE